MENIESEVQKLATGMLYLPKSHRIRLPESTDKITFNELLYDTALVNDDTLNYKFLLPAIEAAKSASIDFIVGFSADLKRIIIAFTNPEGKFQAFTAHQQASLLGEFFLTETVPGEAYAPEEKLIIKSLLLSNQIDNVVKKNEAKIAYSHAGYEALREVMVSKDSPKVMAFDDRNTVIINPDSASNASELLDMVARLVLQLQSQDLSLFEKHVNIQTRYNLYGEKTFNIASGSKKLFDKFRVHPPADLIHEELILITDYKKKVFANLLTGRKGSTDFEQMNLVQLDYTSGLRISVEYIEEESKIVLHLSNFTHCYDKTRFAESRKSVHDRLLKIVVSLGKM